MALTLFLLVPVVAAAWLFSGGRGSPVRVARLVALAASALTLVVAVVVVTVRPEVDARWVPALSLRWHLAVDGISVPLVLLTSALGLAVVLHAGGREPGSDNDRGDRGDRGDSGDSGDTGYTASPDGSNAPNVPRSSAAGPNPSAATFYGCLLLTEFGALTTFLARDAVLFFVAFEVVLVPMWVLISRFGDPHASERDRADASNRFILFTALGSTLMLVGILILVTASGTSDLTELATARGAGLDQATQLTVAVLLVAGLGIKVPLWPAHTWLPPAHTVAPTAGSVLLAAVLLKMGTYGIVRLAISTVPEGFTAVAPFLAAAGAVGIIWGGLACLVERDLKRLVAYSSVAHMGFVAIGLAAGTQTGLQAALFANIAHGLVSALLFFVVGTLKERWGSANLTVARDALRDVSPRTGFALVVGFAAALGLPGLVGFWGEFLAVYAAWSPAVDRPAGLFRACAVVGVVGMALAAAYALRVLRTVWAGHPGWTGAESAARGIDARGTELLVLVTLVVLIVGAGVLPRPLLEVTAPDSATVLGVRPAAHAAGATVEAGP